ncbi:zinc/manganese transport system substrate-binding protein [Salinibacterium amurskyense]|uniref:Zinc/manganese transport system substrate-binding protein n=1 Tax=Salinibacterium amurskyense TaxID=205941 RepID=A0A2M9D6G6_9MICO|nr:zinc ABC transporter substrate-binding protein [Salinibacterium amurskyense]PJJ81103.1 zinc/manganese transport system substrate-binding protein [Salinibacterium amurskyense]RLQ83132.1 ABC transporter substrate-binding protein [Salinibacterium amurskyense]GHD81586.1 putative ABC transporter solute binding protein [Salinibacterium amurskyense]
MSRFTAPLFARHRPRTLTAGAVLAVSALTLAGCSTSEPAEEDGTLSVVASTIVYGNIAATLGGDAVTVTSLIDNPAQDPHSYEASARDQLAVSEADLVIINGGGYDPFAEALYEAAGADAILLNAVEASGLLEDADEHADEDHADEDHADEDHADEDHAEDEADDDHADHDHIEGFNEHIWYSFHAIEHVAEHIAEELTELSPENSDAFETNLDTFLGELEGLEEQADTIAETTEGQGAAVTEPVAVYLLEAVGLHDDTSPEFTEAIEEGSDVPPAALLEVLELVASDHAALLAYNEQTSSPETERVREAAEEAGLPVVSFTETLPEGADYIEWMSSNLDALAVVLVP